MNTNEAEDVVKMREEIVKAMLGTDTAGLLPQTMESSQMTQFRKNGLPCILISQQLTIKFGDGFSLM